MVWKLENRITLANIKNRLQLKSWISIRFSAVVAKEIATTVMNLKGSKQLMNDDRRLHEGSVLRSFFDDQLQHLQKLVSNFASHNQDREQQAEECRQIVENFVDASNNKMRAVHDYSHKLRAHVVALHAHVIAIADQIPPPVDITPTTFGTDPLVNALFVNRNDIDKLFTNDHEVEVYLRSHSNDQIPKLYALLTAIKSEKRMLGIGLQGDMLIREVPQLAVNFSSHKSHTPCSTYAELIVLLRKYLFTCVVVLIKQEMQSHMTDSIIKPSKDSYELRVKSLANPDVYLDKLITNLEKPETLLSIEKIHFKLSKLGIKLDDDDKQSADEFDIHELTWSNSVKNVVLQIALTL